MKKLIVYTCMVCLSLLAEQAVAQSTIESNDEVLTIVDVMPEFPGGEEGMIKFIINTVQYPADAKKKNIEGKVYIKFIVDETGAIQQAQILRGVYASIDAEALRVVNLMPKWKPGSQDGRVVKVWFVLPLEFTLN